MYRSETSNYHESTRTCTRAAASAQGRKKENRPMHAESKRITRANTQGKHTRLRSRRRSRITQVLQVQYALSVLQGETRTDARSSAPHQLYPKCGAESVVAPLTVVTTSSPRKAFGECAECRGSAGVRTSEGGPDEWAVFDVLALQNVGVGIVRRRLVPVHGFHAVVTCVMLSLIHI